jgi:hypothetical protein
MRLDACSSWLWSDWRRHVEPIQLVDARDGSPRPATDVIDPTLLPAGEAIGPTLEGKTERQKNPYPRHSLAWLSWIIARLGGWNCYYKPPGPKTMRAGWATEHARYRVACQALDADFGSPGSG